MPARFCVQTTIEISTKPLVICHSPFVVGGLAASRNSVSRIPQQPSTKGTSEITTAPDSRPESNNPNTSKPSGKKYAASLVVQKPRTAAAKAAIAIIKQTAPPTAPSHSHISK